MGHLYKLDFSNGKSYIGISFKSARNRFKDHCHAAEKRKSKLPVHNAWRKHGEPTLKVLAIVENSTLNEMERKAILSYGTFTPNGYNLTLGGEGTLGHVPSLGHRAKMSAFMKGRSKSLEHRANMSAARKGKQYSLGRKLSAETRAKIGAANHIRVVSMSSREKSRRVRR